MSLSSNYEVEGQLSIFDYSDLATWSGKTYPERSVVTKARTSEPSLKKRQGSQIKTPLFLDLRGGGLRAVASWETDGASLGVYMMHSFGECPREENASRLSQILEEKPHPKYCLSARACQGILNRAEKKGKALPQMLRDALIKQIVTLSKSEGGVEVDSAGKKAGKGALIQAELSATLGVSQDQTLITIGHDERSSQFTDDEITDPLTASDYKSPPPSCDVENIGFMDAYQHYGYRESDKCGTLTAGQNDGVRGDTPFVIGYRKSDYGSYTDDTASATLKNSGGDYGGGSESLIVRGKE